ncbi:MAG: hypothetical protein KDJ71_06815 [Nitrobacter sp.]|nr:hypothetical protein [Nitrobacter sp.]
MQTVLPRSWKEEFALAAAMRREDILFREKLERFEKQRQQRREGERERAEQQTAEILDTIEIVLATREAVAEFRVQLDEYDTATVGALIENQEAIDAVRARIDAMLEEAHVLPDGRRVFKTKDGTRVFDEYGKEVATKIVDPDAIDERHPTWEAFKAETDAKAKLEEDRQQLFEYQAKLDEARERLDKGEITKDELEELKSGLAEDMPDAAREKLGLDQPRANSVPAQSAKPAEVAAAIAMPSNMDTLMRDTGLGPSGP